MLSNDFEHFLQGPITNEKVCKRIWEAIIKYDELPNLVKKQTWRT